MENVDNLWDPFVNFKIISFQFYFQVNNIKIHMQAY